MTRVWLADWEWECCGDPFTVGDEVDFGIESRDARRVPIAVLGPTLAATVQAIESHHERDRPDRVQGFVVAAHAVTHVVVERRSLRRPGHGAPPDAVMPAEGQDWPPTRRELGNGVFAGSRPSRYVIEAVPVADTAVLEPVRGIRLPAHEHDEPRTPPIEPEIEPPLERRTRVLAGWVVDVAEHPSI